MLPLFLQANLLPEASLEMSWKPGHPPMQKAREEEMVGVSQRQLRAKVEKEQERTRRWCYNAPNMFKQHSCERIPGLGWVYLK